MGAPAGETKRHKPERRKGGAILVLLRGGEHALQHEVPYLCRARILL